MNFRYTPKREAHSWAQRSVTMARRAMVASSQHLATLSGYRALAKGGNAVDAAVAMLATLTVVEPHSVAIGGDAFALLYLASEKKLVGMNGSGRAPAAAELEAVRRLGHHSMPERGMLAVTVPGALHGWAQLVERHGRLPLADALQDAIEYARDGFPVTEVIAGEWRAAREVLRAHAGSAGTFLLNGAPPRPGQIFRNPDLAETYRTIAAEGIGALYGGAIGRAVVEFSDRNGGLLSLPDLREHVTTWVDPIAFNYRGYDIVELPPNGQGVVALEMLNILEGYDLRGMETADAVHLLIEAKKIAFHDRDTLIADPDFERVPLERLLAREYGAACRERIDARQASDPGSPFTAPAGGDTVYVAAVDEQGNAASFISSVFMSFGSGMVVDGTGIVLQNRGHGFSLDPAHVNRLAARKRPLHTIIPGMVFRNGEFLMTFGVMGADMQPQGHAQFLINLIDRDMNLQEAMDSPRVRHFSGRDVFLEGGIPDAVRATLQRRGHVLLTDAEDVNQVGGGQAIWVDREQGVLLGASDRRKDGTAIGF